MLAIFLAVYFSGALLTAYVCGRWRFEENVAAASIMSWPFALPIIAIIWAYSKGAAR